MFILDLSHATHKRVKRIPTIGAMPISNIVVINYHNNIANCVQEINWNKTSKDSLTMSDKNKFQSL